MDDILVIFFSIGLAHWTWHLINCRECTKTFIAMFIVLCEGVTRVFGWPLTAMGYVKETYFQKEREAIEEVVYVEKREGETPEEFIARAKREAVEQYNSKGKK